MPATKVTSDEKQAKFWNGNMSSITMTVAAQQAASVTLPTTPVPHNYLCIANYEFTTAGGTGAEMYGQIRHNGDVKDTKYVNSVNGDYITPVGGLTMVVASSGTVSFWVGETAGPRGYLVNRSSYVVVDLGVA